MNSTAKVQRVNHSTRCPICDKPDWCGITPDGKFAICMRVAIGSLKPTRNGGHLHLVDGTPTIHIQAAATTQLASIERRNKINRALLASLKLDEQHHADLRRRGLGDDHIERLQFRSMPDRDRADAIASRLGWEYDGLAGVPGFYFAAGDWRMVAGEWWAGLLIPITDPAGRIEGFQIRRDSNEPRYCWLSSVKRPKSNPNGASPGTPIHYVRPWRVAETHSAIITEGPLKADIISTHLDVCVIAVAGVNSFKFDFGAMLKRELPELRHLYVAYDSDWRTEPKVAGALARLANSLKAARLRGEILIWDGAKGFDDFLGRAS